MKNLKPLFIILVFTASCTLQAQVAVNTDGSNPDNSAMFDIKSTEKGMLIPRMTQTQIKAISNPANGLQVFNIDDGKMYIYLLVSNQWKEVLYGSGVISLPASYTIGTGVSCANTTVNSNYLMGIALIFSNTVNINATVTTPGTWNITTNTINGYSFSGSGTFASTGPVQLTLNGTGTPTTAQTDYFTATANGSGGTCTFSVMVNTNSCGTPITDIDGNIYNTVLIGNQCWMKDNLRTTTYRNGSSISNVTDGASWSNLTTGAYVWYDNNISWKTSYGALYNWFATVDANGLCPTGWHVPTDAEWTALTNYIGGTYPHGSELKSCRQVNSPLGGDCNTTEHPRWNEHSTNYGTDNYGFSGLPGGNRANVGTFGSIGNYAHWWSSTEGSVSTTAWDRDLRYNSDLVNVDDDFKQGGFAVRCIKDN